MFYECFSAFVSDEGCLKGGVGISFVSVKMCVCRF